MKRRRASQDAKNWLQEARASLEARYGSATSVPSCPAFFDGHHEIPLEGSGVNLEDRVRAVRASDNQDISAWHTLLVRMVEQRAAANRDRDGRKL